MRPEMLASACRNDRQAVLQCRIGTDQRSLVGAVDRAVYSVDSIADTIPASRVTLRSAYEPVHGRGDIQGAVHEGDY